MPRPTGRREYRDSFHRRQPLRFPYDSQNVFQIHGVDKKGEVVEKRQLRRHQLLDYFAKALACLIGMEACAAAHYWGRELSKLGHEVRLIPPSYVKPYVRRGKRREQAVGGVWLGSLCRRKPPKVSIGL
ncbi:MAG: hypothetical protein P4M13_04110 [Alphaproteobacteria bacterium]|nr:hypothetical protein [Alphaproteobacteria bacterium]